MRTVTYNENEWRLVPIAATDAMLASGVDNGDWGYHESSLAQRRDSNGSLTDIWTAMLEAAPQPGELADEAAAWMDDIGRVVSADHKARIADYDGNEHRSGKYVIPLYKSNQPDAARDADAARYRWLRKRNNPVEVTVLEHRFEEVYVRDGEDLDAAIDAAMAAGRGEVGT